MSGVPPPATATAGRIGPNAIWRHAEALEQHAGETTLTVVFGLAGLARYLEQMPQGMVDEREVSALHRSLRAVLDVERAERVSRTAGERTADYLLARRIPQPVQWLLRHLPAAVAARVLVAAIGRHAWTFSGSGRFSVQRGRPLRITIARGPIADGIQSPRPVCMYYAATFERLFRALVHPLAAVNEIACEATGAPACVFEIRW